MYIYTYIYNMYIHMYNIYIYLSDAKEISLSLSHPALQIFQDVAQPALSLSKDSRATTESV